MLVVAVPVVVLVSVALDTEEVDDVLLSVVSVRLLVPLTEVAVLAVVLDVRLSVELVAVLVLVIVRVDVEQEQH